MTTIKFPILPSHAVRQLYRWMLIDKATLQTYKCMLDCYEVEVLSGTYSITFEDKLILTPSSMWGRKEK